MANSEVFALQNSGLNDFLLSTVGIEANGMALSVISVFARLGCDPWREAGRLASLQKPAAIDSLARTIASMPASMWPQPDATTIAARLIAALPARLQMADNPSLYDMLRPCSAGALLLAAGIALGGICAAGLFIGSEGGVPGSNKSLAPTANADRVLSTTPANAPGSNGDRAP
jgi:hypothetical protein